MATYERSAGAGVAELREADLSPLTGARSPRHLAVIMDGNGRWARQRGLPRAAGHRAGTENIRRIIERVDQHGIRYLTLYAFSTENWRRPRTEVRALIRLLSRFIKREVDNFDRNNVRLQLLGNVDTLPEWLQHQVNEAVDRTARNTGLVLSICFSYGGRDDIVQAVRRIVAEGTPVEAINEDTIACHLSTAGMPDPDLVIRTAGDLRISNFLIWQCAYAELYFTETFWPDFGRNEIDAAVAEYGRRKRKFGALPPEEDVLFDEVE